MPVNSPFKFLDAYNQDDKEIFFGRDDEIELLYQMVFQSNLTLVYGQSGTGKTSLIQCGLANCFAQSDWFNVYIRRNEDINTSLVEKLKEYKIDEQKETSLLKKRLMKRRESAGKNSAVSVMEPPKAKEEKGLIDTLQSLYKHYLKPVYLIFDQFEELFILGTKEEQTQFYQTISQILETEPYCRIILIMREEAIAELHDFEKVVPTLFDKRLRVEPMGRHKTREVIQKSTERFDIKLGCSKVPDAIIDALSVGEGRVELTYLQVFLDNLFNEAAENNPDEIVFNLDLVKKLGTIEDVLGDFLIKQISEIQESLKNKFEGIPETVIKKLLTSFITLEGTKRPLTLEMIPKGQFKPVWIEFLLLEFEKRRIIRNEDNMYELSHDALAKEIAELRGAEDVAVLQASRLIKNRFVAFQKTKTYLNSNELALVNQVKGRLKEDQILSKEEYEYIEKSRKAKRKRRIKIVVSLVSFIAILIVTLIHIQGLYRQSEENFKELEITQVNELVNLGDVYKKKKDYTAAKEAYERAKHLFKHEPAKSIIPDSLKSKIEGRIENATEMVAIGNKFDKLVEEADEVFELSPHNEQDTLYIGGLRKYQEADQLDYNHTLLTHRIALARVKLESTYEKFVRKGEKFERTPVGLSDAIRYYKKALIIKKALSLDPEDSTIEDKINELERNIK